MNSVNLTGRLTRDPELRHTQGGTAVCEMSIAVDRASPEKDENDHYKAGFFDIVVFGDVAENCAQYLAKGRKVGVNGSLQQQRWQDRDTGKNRSRVEIKAFQVEFLDRPPDDGSGQQFVPASQFVPAAGAADDVPDSTDFAPGPGPGPGSSSYDDDIPFEPIL